MAEYIAFPVAELPMDDAEAIAFVRELAEAERQKSLDRATWITTHTCPHCGACPPFPGDEW